MIAVPCAARLTCGVDPPREGTVRSVPASATKLTGNETGDSVRLVKYKAEYQPPPNANCGRTLDLGFDAEQVIVYYQDLVEISPI
jgi:hypothetical protein